MKAYNVNINHETLTDLITNHLSDIDEYLILQLERISHDGHLSVEMLEAYYNELCSIHTDDSAANCINDLISCSVLEEVNINGTSALMLMAACQKMRK